MATPAVDMWQHASGARVALVAAPAIPMLDVRLEFDAGTRRDPAPQAGLASAAALMSGRGVAAQGNQPALDENQLAESWMDLGAQWSVSAGTDRLSATLRTLTAADVLPGALALAARQLAQPRFDSAYAAPIWQRERERLSAAWQNDSTQPGTVSQRRYAQAVYGAHPYGFEATPDTLARIGVADMQAWWQRHVRACDARVSLVGAVDRAQADAIVSQLLAGIRQVPCTALPTVAEVEPLKAPSEQRIPMATAQAHVLIGQPGHRREDPDFFPLLVGNYVLGGGGFVSRLTTEVREKRGLTYGVYSYFSPGIHAGAFTVGLQTRRDQADQALSLVRDVVRGFVADGPTDTELQAAKDNLINGFVLRIDTNRKLLDNVANINWYGLPADYLQTWTQRIQAVQATDVRRAFQRVLQPGNMAAVVVGGAGG
jgi:zinc protease